MSNELKNQLDWKDNVPTMLQPGVYIAQGIRRIYCIDSTLVGNNRFRAGIRRGCFVYWSNIPAEKLEDAKSILQADHDAIHEAIEESIEEAKPKWIPVSERLPEEKTLGQMFDEIVNREMQHDGNWQDLSLRERSATEKACKFIIEYAVEEANRNTSYLAGLANRRQRDLAQERETSKRLQKELEEEKAISTGLQAIVRAYESTRKES